MKRVLRSSKSTSSLSSFSSSSSKLSGETDLRLLSTTLLPLDFFVGDSIENAATAFASCHLVSNGAEITVIVHTFLLGVDAGEGTRGIVAEVIAEFARTMMVKRRIQVFVCLGVSTKFLSDALRVFTWSCATAQTNCDSNVLFRNYIQHGTLQTLLDTFNVEIPGWTIRGYAYKEKESSRHLASTASHLVLSSGAGHHRTLIISPCHLVHTSAILILGSKV